MTNIVEYHLFTIKPLEKYYSAQEAIAPIDQVNEALRVISGLRTQLETASKKVKAPVQAYAFVNDKPAILIRADGSLYFLEKYLPVRERILEVINAFPNFSVIKESHLNSSGG